MKFAVLALLGVSVCNAINEGDVCANNLACMTPIPGVPTVDAVTKVKITSEPTYDYNAATLTCGMK